MVLLVGIKSHRVDLELGQLAPPSAPRPLTKAYIDGICAQQPNIPPLSQQVAVFQQPYCAHEVIVTQAGLGRPTHTNKQLCVGIRQNLEELRASVSASESSQARSSRPYRPRHDPELRPAKTFFSLNRPK